MAVAGNVGSPPTTAAKSSAPHQHVSPDHGRDSRVRRRLGPPTVVDPQPLIRGRGDRGLARPRAALRELGDGLLVVAHCVNTEGGIDHEPVLVDPLSPR